MRRRRLTPTGILTGLLLALQTTPLASQTPADRLALSAFRDSLASITDTTLLRDGQRTLRETTRRRPEGTLARIRLGLVSLRLAEVGATPDARDAVKALRAAAEKQPAWPYAWYALGLAEALRAAWEREDRLALGNRVGLPTLSAPPHGTGAHSRPIDRSRRRPWRWRH